MAFLWGMLAAGLTNLVEENSRYGGEESDAIGFGFMSLAFALILFFINRNRLRRVWVITFFGACFFLISVFFAYQADQNTQYSLSLRDYIFYTHNVIAYLVLALMVIHNYLLHLVNKDEPKTTSDKRP